MCVTLYLFPSANVSVLLATAQRTESTVVYIAAYAVGTIVTFSGRRRIFEHEEILQQDLQAKIFCHNVYDFVLAQT